MRGKNKKFANKNCVKWWENWNWNPSVTAVICLSLELTKQWWNADAENEMGIDIKCDQIDKCNAISEGLLWSDTEIT